MKSRSPEVTDWYVKGRGYWNLGTGLRFIRTPCLKPGDLKFNTCPVKSEGRPKYCRLQNSALKGRQSPPAALNKSIILSSRFQRRCRKPGSVYCQNHRVVSFYFLNILTCRCLFISSHIPKQQRIKRAEFREINCSTGHPLQRGAQPNTCVPLGSLRKTAMKPVISGRYRFIVRGRGCRG